MKKENLAKFEWLRGPYEAGSDRPAIELIAGDGDLLQYLNGMVKEDVILKKMVEEERRWLKITKPFLLYDEPLFSILQ